MNICSFTFLAIHDFTLKPHVSYRVAAVSSEQEPIALTIRGQNNGRDEIGTCGIEWLAEVEGDASTLSKEVKSSYFSSIFLPFMQIYTNGLQGISAGTGTGTGKPFWWVKKSRQLVG